MLTIARAKYLGVRTPYSAGFVPFSNSKNLYMVKPKLIMEVAVLTHAMRVRSCASQVRSRAICVESSREDRLSGGISPLLISKFQNSGRPRVNTRRQFEFGDGNNQISKRSHIFLRCP